MVTESMRVDGKIYRSWRHVQARNPVPLAREIGAPKNRARLLTRSPASLLQVEKGRTPMSQYQRDVFARSGCFNGRRRGRGLVTVRDGAPAVSPGGGRIRVLRRARARGRAGRARVGVRAPRTGGADRRPARSRQVTRRAQV